jgi:hypothetical protein
MRRPLVTIPLLLALCACSSGPTAAVNPIPLSGLPALAGVEIAGARQALIDFLNGYAHAGTDGGKELEHLVADGPPELRDWVTWLVVQNDSNPGELSGTASIRAIRFQSFTTTQGTIPTAGFSLDATVTLTYRPPDAAPVVITHDFSGAATVFERRPGDWVVYDVTRDQQSMDSSIHLLSDLTLASSGVDMHIRSIWTLRPFFSFNVTVSNHGPNAVSLDDAKTGLVGATRSDITAPQSHTSELDHIPPGGSAMGTINFGPPPSSTSGLVVAFDAAKGPPVELSVSVNRLLGAVPGSPTTAPASPSPAG